MGTLAQMNGGGAMSDTQKPTAILPADVADYSRLPAVVAQTVARLHATR